MTDNPWLPIDTMPLSTVGTEVDVREDRRLHSGVRVSGIWYEREVLVETRWGDGDKFISMGDVADFTIRTTTGTIYVTPSAEWRPHV